MATRGISPRADNEGSIGTSSLRWGDFRAVLSTIGTAVITTLTATTSTLTTAVITTLTATTATITNLVKGTVITAGTASVAPLVFTSGTNLTSAAAGAREYDGLVFYSTPIASQRGVDVSMMYAIVEAGDFALLTTSGVQSCFPTTKDVWTLGAAVTYEFEGVYFITKTTTTVTIALAFAASSAPTSINYFVEAFNAAADTTSATVAMTYVDQVATTVINATATTATAIKFKGLLRTNGATTITPQINFSANTTVPVMKAGSYITYKPLGTSTQNTVGNVA